MDHPDENANPAGDGGLATPASGPGRGQKIASNVRGLPSPARPPTVMTTTTTITAGRSRSNQTPRQRPRAISLMALVQDPPTLPDLTGLSPNLDVGRVQDWKDVPIGSIVTPDSARFVPSTATVEEATRILVNCGSPNVVIVTDNVDSKTARATFDYSDLNRYLLCQVDKARTEPPDGQHVTRQPDRLRDIIDVEQREPLVTVSTHARMETAVEFLAAGVHRLLVTDAAEDGSESVVGVLTQLRLVRFFYDNRRNFPDLADLYTRPLANLQIGSREVVSARGQVALYDALSMLQAQGITSIPVLDKDENVVGNLSQVDTRLLIRESSLPLFDGSCASFISVIVSERGIVDGKDSFPVFYVNPHSTLAFAVAKLLATRSHRVWVVNGHCASPCVSHATTPSTVGTVPQTPLFQQRHALSNSSGIAISPGSVSGRRRSVGTSTIPASGISSSSSAPSPLFGNPLSQSGRLDGVVSLTDVLNLFGRTCNVATTNPDGVRIQWHRRRSSSSSSSSAAGRTSMSGGFDGLDGVARVAGRDRSVSSQSRTSNLSFSAVRPTSGRR